MRHHSPALPFTHNLLLQRPDADVHGQATEAYWLSGTSSFKGILPFNHITHGYRAKLCDMLLT